MDNGEGMPVIGNNKSGYVIMLAWLRALETNEADYLDMNSFGHVRYWQDQTTELQPAFEIDLTSELSRWERVGQ